MLAFQFVLINLLNWILKSLYWSELSILSCDLVVQNSSDKWLYYYNTSILRCSICWACEQLADTDLYNTVSRGLLKHFSHVYDSGQRERERGLRETGHRTTNSCKDIAVLCYTFIVPPGTGSHVPSNCMGCSADSYQCGLQTVTASGSRSHY